MKTVLSNFKLKEVIGINAITWKFRATVDCTTSTGIFIKKQETKTVEVFKNYSSPWYFSDTGKFEVNCEVSNQERIFCAKYGVSLHKCPVEKSKGNAYTT
jgi:hypothetical protein